jgi:hypothetical protein
METIERIVIAAHQIQNSYDAGEPTPIHGLTVPRDNLPDATPHDVRARGGGPVEPERR